MRGRAAQKARGLGASGSPLLSDFLLALRGQPKAAPKRASTNERLHPSVGACKNNLEAFSTGAPEGQQGSQNGVNCQFPDFQARVAFGRAAPKACYFPPHMSRGVVELQKKAAEVDCLVEVRDARAPLTSSGCLEAIKPSKHLKRLIVLNKCDLVSSTDAKKAQELLQAAGLESVLVSAKQRKGLHKVTEWVLGTPEPKFSSIGRWLLLAGLPNTGKSSILNALKALAFSASFHGKPGNQLVQGVNKTTAKTGKLPGVTRDVNAFQLTNKPKVFCFDSPGILLPKNCDQGRSLILGVLGILPEHLIGEELAADYLLFQLNKNRQFGYVQVLGLNGPTNDIYEVSRHICQTLGRRQERFSLPPVDLSPGFVFFLNLFREGHLASLCLDTLPYAADVVLRRDVLGQQREPPDPWLLTDQEMPVPGLN